MTVMGVQKVFFPLTHYTNTVEYSAESEKQAARGSNAVHLIIKCKLLFSLVNWKEKQLKQLSAVEKKKKEQW